jgi:uncharacterized protein (DUF1697 family)
MARFAAFLRAVNVGGTGQLPMAALKALCESLGFTQVRTYIASGNVVFETALSRGAAQARFEAALRLHMGKDVGLFLRDAAELQAVVDANPFQAAPANRVMVVLLDANPEPALLATAMGRADEEMSLGPSCLFLHYPSGMGKSKLKIPGAALGTARNMNTIRAVLGLLDD